MKTYKITVKQENNEAATLTATEGQNLLALLHDNGFSPASPCGGKGTCGKCRVKVFQGAKTKTTHTSTEKSFFNESQMKAGYKLACQVKIVEDLSIDIPLGNPESALIMVDGEHEVPLNPLITQKTITLSKPTVDDQLSDVDRVEQSLGVSGSIPPELFLELPGLLRTANYRLTCIQADGEVLSIRRSIEEKPEEIFGMAVDIGTTTMVGYLLDLTTGKQVNSAARLNPQRIHGADVITRIDYTIQNEQGLAKLGDLVREEINNMIRQFSLNDPDLPGKIFDLTIVGNTTMLHIFAGLEVRNIAVSPFIPVVTRNFTLSPVQIGLEINPYGKVRVLPMISGYVGADTIGAILASGMTDQPELSILLDIGTNGEIAIGNNERIVTCSTAAGPAFEGANIRHGMGGVNGAINRVWINEDVTFTTIGGVPAKGICGSAVVDLVSEMLKAGLIEESGRIKRPDELGDKTPAGARQLLRQRLKEVAGKPAFLVASKSEGAVEDLYFTQKDVREVQLAKAAIAAGIQILLTEMGVTAEEVQSLYLAGGFGNYINHHAAVNISLLPKELEEKVVPIGNGAGVGGKMALLSQECFNKALQIREKAKYLELSTRMDFQNLFIDLMEFQ